MLKNKKNPLDVFSDESAVIDSKFKQDLKKNLFKEDKVMKKTKQLAFLELVTQRSFLYIGSLALVLMVGATAFGVSSNNKSSARQSVIEQSIEVPKNLDNILTMSQAQLIVESNLPTGVTVSGLDLETEQGTVIYKVRLSDGTYKLIDAITGVDFVDGDVDTEGPTDKDAAVVDTVNGITLQEARTIASNERPGKTIVKIKLDTEKGVTVYSVRFSDGVRVDVKVLGGSIVRVVDEQTANKPAEPADINSTDTNSNEVDKSLDKSKDTDKIGSDQTHDSNNDTDSGQDVDPTQ